MRRPSVAATQRKPTGSMTFENPQGPHAAVTTMFTKRPQSSSLPPIPRLQLTAADEKHRNLEVFVPSSPHKMLEYFSNMPASSRPQSVVQSARPEILQGISSDKVDVPLYSQYTRWFSDNRSREHATIGQQLKPCSAASLHSPRLEMHSTMRAEAMKAIETALGKPIPINLIQIVHIFLSRVTRQGSQQLSAASVTAALRDLDVDNVVTADKFFSLLDVSKSSRVPVATIIVICDMCINSVTFGPKVRQSCFDLLDFTGSGYIHALHLDEIKAEMGKDKTFSASGATSNMVRALGVIFMEARQAEEEQYINNVLLKKSKKKKKKAPPLKPNQKSHIPPTMRRIGHLDLDQFVKYFDTSRELAAAFFPRILSVLLGDSSLQHGCVMRAISLAEEAAAES